MHVFFPLVETKCVLKSTRLKKKHIFFGQFTTLLKIPNKKTEYRYPKINVISGTGNPIWGIVERLVAYKKKK